MQGYGMEQPMSIVLARRGRGCCRCTAAVSLGLVVLFLGASAQAQINYASVPHDREVVIQWFQTSWSTMSRRMGDAFVAGYQGIWLPPPTRGGSPFSVGYDLYDRFDFGRASGERTRYGHLGGLLSVVERGHRAGMSMYADIILNHNGFGTKFDTAFANAGGYPGFVFTAPGDEWGDFHAPGSSDEIYMYLANLIDIAQEKNHVYIRHPVDPNDPRNIPTAGRPNQPITQANRRFYPDLDPAPGDVLTPSGFNLTNPLGGDPVPENATGLLLRSVRYLHEVIGVHGFRIDAAKHIPPWFFWDFYDAAVFQKGRPDLNGNRVTPFSFNEALDTNYQKLAPYRRRDGYGNRDNKDFVLFFALRDVFNNNGFGHIGNLRHNTYDNMDGDSMDGSAGVMFASSHDDDNVGWSDTAHAYILTRAGMSLVYHNALEFGRSGLNPPFPREFGSRGDALGDYGTVITKLVDIHRRFARGPMLDRWNTPDYFIYERSGRLLVGICDRRLQGYVTQTVPTNFPAGTLLIEQSGNAAAYNAVHGANTIPETIVVPSGQSVTLRIPEDGSNDGYVIYAPATPGLVSLTLSNSTVIPPDTLPANPSLTDRARRRLTETWRVTSNSSTLTLRTDGGEINALLKVNRGVDVNGNGQVDIRTGGLTGFEEFTSRSVGASGGTGTYSIVLDWAALGEGYHYIEVIALANGPAGLPLCWSSWRRVVYVDRQRPAVTIESPMVGQVLPVGYHEIVVRTDGSEDNVLVNVDFQAVDNRPVHQFTQMDAVGPREWRATVPIRNFDRYVTVRAYEETGAYGDTVRVFNGPGAPNHTPIPGRVRIRPNPPQLGHPLLVEYDYLLGPLSAADQIFIRKGANYWSVPDTPDQPMTRNPDTGYYEFMYTVPPYAFVVDFAFRNSAGVFDNNNGADWHFEVIDPPPGTPTPTFTTRPSNTPTATATSTPAPRVVVVPNPPQLGQPVTISYNKSGGPLANTTRIYLHKGANYWSIVDLFDVEMFLNPQNGRYEYTYNVPGNAFVIDMRFTDGQTGGVVDNNNGADWHFEVIDAPTPTPGGGLRPIYSLY